MNTTAMWVILFRWMHLLAACIAVGGAIVMRFVLPAGLKKIEGEQREVVFLACRRAFKMFVPPTVLLILISGTYNSIHNWHAYTGDPALLHSLWGTHVLFGLIAITIALWVLAGKKPPAWHRTAMAF